MGVRTKVLEIYHYVPLICIPILLLNEGGNGQHIMEKSPVFSLQPDIWEAPRSDVYLKFDMKHQEVARAVSEFTFCQRIYHTSLTKLQVLVSYAISDDRDNDIMMYIKNGKPSFRYNNNPQPSVEKINLPIKLRTWQHFCHVISNNSYSFYMEGNLIASNVLNSVNEMLILNGTLVIGQEQDDLEGDFNPQQTLKGLVSQINMWSYPLADDEIRAIASCERNMNGNVFSSDRDNIEYINATLEYKSNNFCKINKKFLVYPEKRTFLESVVLCKISGSSLYAPESYIDSNALYETVNNENICYGSEKIWLGLTDEKEEGIWRRLDNNNIVTKLNFIHGQPDNIRSENCLLMDKNSGKLSDMPCDEGDQACSPCEERDSMLFHLRGLCQSTRAEVMVEMLGYIYGKPYFHGFYGFIIYKSSTLDWVLHDTVVNKSLATISFASSNIYPLGRHHWTLLEPVCDNPVSSKQHLSLSICDEGEFMCKNGQCIPILSRCDAKDDCADESDEDDCFIISIPEGYQVFKPPKNVDNASAPLTPFTEVEILRFLKIDDTQEATFLELIVRIYWKDSRLKYLNLKHNIHANKLSVKESSGIWKPLIEFTNVNDGNLKLIKSDYFIMMNGTRLPFDFNSVDMDMVYGGSEAQIIQQEHFSGSFVCKFDVYYYPFDSQVCNVMLDLSTECKNCVSFHNDLVMAHYNHDPHLSTYTVLDFTAHVDTSQTRSSALKVGFRLERRYTLILLSVFLPTYMFLILGYATLFVRASLLQVRLFVSMTTLLVLYTFFNKTSADLPKTSYVKMIDIWFFFCTILIFSIIVVHVVVEWLEVMQVVKVMPIFVNGVGQATDTSSAKTTDARISSNMVLKIMRKIVVPAVFILFNIGYWSIMLLSLNK